MKNSFTSLAALTMGISILSYDAHTNLYARIKSGSVWGDLQRVYTNGMTGEFYTINYAVGKKVLTDKYVPSYEAAKKATSIGDMTFMQRSLNAYRNQ